MSMSNALETALLALIFNATAWSNMADNAASTPQTAISTALHTADPGESGDLTTSEVTYTSYARVDVSRDSGGFTVSGNTAVPAANIDFPAGTGGSGTATYFSFGKTGGGSKAIHFSGTVTPNIVTGNGVTPRLSTSTSVALD
jgi:hypothetical protein